MKTLFFILAILACTSQQGVKTYDLDKVDVQPEYPNELSGFKKYLMDNITKHDKLNGKAMVEFVVGTTGKVTDAKVILGIGECCDKDIIKVFKNSPVWKPGKKDGKKVNVKMIIPLNF